MADKQDDTFYEQLLKIVGSKEKFEKICELIEIRDEEEKEWRRNIQMEGIQKAKENGVSLGRPKIDLPENFEEICAKYKEGKLSAQDGASLCNMGISTFYRRIRDYEEEKMNMELSLI